MLTPFVLEGRHARLEPLSESHVPGLAEAAAEDRSSYAYTWVPEGTAQAEEYVRSALADHARGRSLPWAVRRLADGRIVGSTRYLDLEVFGATPTEPAQPPTDGRPPSVLEIGRTWYAHARRPFPARLQRAAVFAVPAARRPPREWKNPRSLYRRKELQAAIQL